MEKCDGCKMIKTKTHMVITQTTKLNVCTDCLYGRPLNGNKGIINLDKNNEIEDLLYNADEIAIMRTIEELKDDLIDWGVWANGTHCAEINIDDVKRITRVVFELERRMKV